MEILTNMHLVVQIKLSKYHYGKSFETKTDTVISCVYFDLMYYESYLVNEVKPDAKYEYMPSCGCEVLSSFSKFNNWFLFYCRWIYVIKKPQFHIY